LSRTPDLGWDSSIDETLRAMIAACIDSDADKRPLALALSEQLRAFEPLVRELTTDRSEALATAQTPKADAARADISPIGQIIGPYWLMDKLGEGGMGSRSQVNQNRHGHGAGFSAL
jgi:hypothetical protein